jgi:hypothetical protein
MRQRLPSSAQLRRLSVGMILLTAFSAESCLWALANSVTREGLW